MCITVAVGRGFYRGRSQSNSFDEAVSLCTFSFIKCGAELQLVQIRTDDVSSMDWSLVTYVAQAKK